MNEFVKAGVIGHPIKHSKSPRIHGYWIQKYECTGSYTAIDIHPEHLERDITRLIDENYKGFNVTIPHKEAIIDLCHDLDPAARAIGAVNTVVIEDDKLHGFNTDGFGFVHNILETIPDFSIPGKHAVLLGAGGATRAIAHALISENIAQITITNRTRERAEAIQKDMADLGAKIEIADWDTRSKILQGADLLVNTTSLGMDGQPPLEIDLKHLPQNAIVNDTVYAPLQTGLLKTAHAGGYKTVTGIGMLIHQARPAFEHWFGFLPDVSEILKTMVLK